ncbi:MAG: LysM peptidoglycan-binding domain-containing protein [Salibacteraceae bacterium]
MAGISTGFLKKMQIQAYSDPEFSSTNGSPISVMINPTRYTHKYAIKYNDTNECGANGASPKFKKIAREEVNFELVFDGTGAVSLFETDVVTHIQNLKETVYTFVGSQHEPNYVQLLWGTMIFNCRLTNMEVSYTLFKPSGTPLRARVNLSFIGFTDEDTLAKLANKSSPDLTHIVTVQAGDTLPLMCYRIYNNSGYYLKVANENGLDDFRDIVPGQKLIFPPVSK